jgi:hypothetical protein
MQNLVVGSHILNLLQSEDQSESQDVLNVYDRAFIDSLSSLDTTPLSGQKITRTVALCSIAVQQIYDTSPVNVKDFGAKGDGVTDDWLAIQRAIYHASWQWQTAGWPLATALSGDDQTKVVPFFNGYSKAIPMIWGGQGHQPVYLPTGTYIVSKPLIITHGTRLYGDISDKTILQLHDSSNCSVIESKNLAIRRMHPDVYEHVDEWNANAAISNISIRRGSAPLVDPTKKDYMATTILLSGILGNYSFNRSAPTVSGGALAPIEFPIKLLYEDDTEYTVLSSDGATVHVYPAITKSTPVSGQRMMIGVPSLKGIYVSGGENFTIDRVYASMGWYGVGIYVNGGSPGPVIRNCMNNGNKVGYWIDNYPVLLDTPSGDANLSFIKSGALRFSNVTINSCKIEFMSGHVFDFGGFAGSDACQYNIVGGTVNSELNVDPLSTCIIVRIGSTNPLLHPKISIQGMRFFMAGSYFLNPISKYDTTDFSNLRITKGSSLGTYPNYLFWEFGNDKITKWDNTSTIVQENSASWTAGGPSVGQAPMFNLSKVRDIIPLGYSKSTATDAVATTAEYTGFTINPGISAASWARAAITRIITGNPGETSSNANATIPFAIAQTCFPLIPTSGNSGIRFVVGETGSGNPPPLSSDCISGKGFGLRVDYSVVNVRAEGKLFAHNGTTYVESSAFPLSIATGATAPGILSNIILSTDGAGNIKCFTSTGTNNGLPTVPSDTPTMTLSGGPSSTTLAGPYYSVIVLNGSESAGSQRVSVKGINSMIHVGDIY